MSEGLKYTLSCLAVFVSSSVTLLSSSKIWTFDNLGEWKERTKNDFREKWALTILIKLLLFNYDESGVVLVKSSQIKY